MKNGETTAVLLNFEDGPAIISSTGCGSPVERAVRSLKQASGRSTTSDKVPQNSEPLPVRWDLENCATILGATLIGRAVDEAITGLDDRSTRRIAGHSRGFKGKNPLI